MTRRANSSALSSRRGKTNSNRQAPIDFSRLKRMAAEATEDLEELVGFYLKTTRDQLNELERAVRLQSAVEVKALAHNCIGASNLLGMQAMVLPLQQLEQLAAECDWNQAANALAYAWKALDNIQSFLKTRDGRRENA